MAPNNWLLRPVDVSKDCQLDHIDGSVIALLVLFASVGDENMVLTIVQLLRVALKSRLIVMLLIALIKTLPISNVPLVLKT